MTEGRGRGRRPGRPRDPAADEVILRAAVELFIEHGVEGANFEQIAKRSGVSRATIYRRWRSKEALLASALRKATLPRAESADVIANMTVSELVAYLTDMFTDTLTRPESSILAARMIGSIPTHPEFLAVYRERFVEPTRRAISSVLARARRAGAVPRLPDQDLVLAVLSGAITHRVLTRTDAPDRKRERKWVRRLLAHVRLPIPPQ
jgi:AcrR family transcriptional regulator